MKIIQNSLLLLIISLGFHLPGKAFILSDEAKISVLTCSPGTELYSLFGHTAIRVCDPILRYDQVFNYGTFDFQTPNFYLKYAKGLLPYQLSEISFHHFMYAYQMENRSVYEQVLNLDSLQRQHLFDRLQENRRPQNRYYLYNFLFDNCTTRARDIIQKSLPDTIAWNAADNGKSFWNLLDEYLQTSPWVQWGIHTILGQRGNREATPFQYMFLPDYLLSGLTTAQYNGKAVAEEVKTLYIAPTEKINNPWYRHPLFIFSSGVFLWIGLLYRLKSKTLFYTTTVLLFLFSGIVGCLIVFLGGFTAHPITAPNWNILWANPLNLILWPFLLRKHLSRFCFIYLNVYMFLLLVAVPVWIFTYPAVPIASIPWIIFLFYISMQYRKNYLSQKAIFKSDQKKY